MTITASAFKEKILGGGPKGKPFAPDAYERALVEAIDAGGIAPFIARYVPVTITQKLKDGVTHTLVIGVAPNYLAIGTDTDWFLAPATPWTYQYVADQRKAILPTRKLTKDIFDAARKTAIAIEPHPFGTKNAAGKEDGGVYNETVPRFVESDAFVHDQLAKIPAFNVNTLVTGAKKDVVVTPKMDGSRVDIYGWYRLTDLLPWQNSFGPHVGTYKDYSHGGRLIDRSALLDGKKVDLYDVFQDPVLSALVSDQGPFLPHFPNEGKMAAPVAFFPTGDVPPTAGAVSATSGKRRSDGGNGLALAGLAAIGIAWIASKARAARMG